MAEDNKGRTALAVPIQIYVTTTHQCVAAFPRYQDHFNSYPNKLSQSRRISSMLIFLKNLL